ncbi:12289_t:CDS:2 [Entrophospora sp. SA101]|nr:12289_t:CDS:2 [Entrophospora sp. SA101]
MQREYQKEYEGTNEDVSIIRTTSSVYNPVEFLEYLASQEQYLPNVIGVVDNTNQYNNDNEMIKNPHQKSSSEPPLSNTYSGINKRPRSSPLHLSPLEEVQNQIVGLKNSQSHSILDYQNNDNNTAENNRLKLSNVLLTLSPLSKSTDQQSLIPSKKPKPYKVKSGAFIMCLEIFILGVIILVSWKITDLTDGNTALFNITTGIGTIPIIHNKTTTNT